MLESIIKIFEQYGVLGVILIVMAAIIVFLVNYLIKNIKGDVHNIFETLSTTLSKNLTDQNNKLVDTLNKQNDKLIDIVTHQNINTKNKHDNLWSERANSSREISHKLRDICLQYQSYFTAIFEFHNTSDNLSGVPFAKFTCNFEYVANRKQATLVKTVMGFPFTMIEPIVTDLLNNSSDNIPRQTVYEDLYNLPEEFDISVDIFNQMPTRPKGLIVNAMWDTNNEKMIGLLLVGYDNEIPKNIKLNELKFETSQLSSVITLRNKNVNKQ